MMKRMLVWWREEKAVRSVLKEDTIIVCTNAMLLNPERLYRLVLFCIAKIPVCRLRLDQLIRLEINVPPRCNAYL